MGLRLSDRETWPPASSELRLVLMGILSDCYNASVVDESSFSPEGFSRTGTKVPGDLSFSIRDLSSGEIDKATDASSLEALDFLRLSYKAPVELKLVMSPLILGHYDRIFRHLLRVLRVSYAANQLYRDVIGKSTCWTNPDNAAVRLRTEATHFVNSVCSYMLETGIAVPWQKFQAYMDRAEEDVGRESWHDGAGTRHSPDRIREAHQRCLEDMMALLFLRKRQSKVLGLLEDVFRIVLKFAKEARVRYRADLGGRADESDYRKLYEAFRGKVQLFIAVCRGLADDSRYGSGEKAKQLGEASAMANLVLKMDMSGFYASTAA